MTASIFFKIGVYSGEGGGEVRIKSLWRLFFWFFEAFWFLIRGSGDRYIEVRRGSLSDELTEETKGWIAPDFQISRRPPIAPAVVTPRSKKVNMSLVGRRPFDPDSAA